LLASACGILASTALFVPDVPRSEGCGTINNSPNERRNTMYVDINSVSYDAKNNLAIIEGIDLDSVLLNDWNQELSNKAEVTFKFDLTGKGPRIYLYKLLKSQVKEECKTMEEMLMALTGKITNISSNFISKAEG
jgi:hypothetical protein